MGIAVVIFITRNKTQTRQGLWGLIHYCTKDSKTLNDRKRLVSGINCVARSAFNEMMNTKLRYRKANSRMYYHLMQYFHPEELLTLETAHEIALRFEGEFFSGFEVLITTHIGRGHIYSHFVLNSVNVETGYKYHSDNNETQRLLTPQTNCVWNTDCPWSYPRAKGLRVCR